MVNLCQLLIEKNIGRLYLSIHLNIIKSKEQNKVSKKESRKAIQVGLEKGRAEGINKAYHDVAFSMKGNDYSEEEIAKILDISLDKV